MKKIVIQSEFKTNLKKLKKSGIKFESKFKKVLNSLCFGKKLEDSLKDHKLKGDLKEYRECHLKPDLLLVYKTDEEKVILVNIGSHSDLFGKKAK